MGFIGHKLQSPLPCCDCLFRKVPLTQRRCEPTRWSHSSEFLPPPAFSLTTRHNITHTNRFIAHASSLTRVFPRVSTSKFTISIRFPSFYLSPLPAASRQAPAVFPPEKKHILTNIERTTIVRRSDKRTHCLPFPVNTATASCTCARLRYQMSLRLRLAVGFAVPLSCQPPILHHLQ